MVFLERTESRFFNDFLLCWIVFSSFWLAYILMTASDTDASLLFDNF